MTDEQCRQVEVDGQIVRVRGERAMDDADRAALAEVIAAAKRELDAMSDSEIDDGRHGFCETCGVEHPDVQFCPDCGDAVVDDEYLT